VRKKVFLILLCALLAAGIFLTSCGEDPEGGNTIITQPKPITIKKNPASKSCAMEDWLSNPLTLTVELSEQKSATYQWYKRIQASGAWEEIAGETGTSYKPEITADGDYYYSVAVKVDGKDLVGTSHIRIGNAQPAPTQFTIGSDRVSYVRGVGGTGAFMFREGGGADASPDADARYIDLLMGEMGCNILRIMVQDDYENYLQNQVQSRNSNVFYHNARDNFFAVIRKVNDYNGYVFANPWTAPGRFKDNKSVAGGSNSSITNTPSNFVGYADWLRGFLQWLNDNNAPIFSLGILNEPDWGGQSSYEGMDMSPEVHRDWLRTVGHITTQRVTNQSGAGLTSSIFEDAVIPGFGGGRKTHHVVVMSADNMGDPAWYNDTINNNSGNRPANNNFEILGRHWYKNNTRVSALAGPPDTMWDYRPQTNFVLRGDLNYEDAAIKASPHMYAPGSTAGNIKREIWQTEHDFNNVSSSTNIPASNVQRYWNSVFAVLNDLDWGLRVINESVYDWWFSSSWSGLVTSYQGTPINGDGKAGNAGATPWPAYTYTPRGRAFAHFARYVNETWLLPMTSTGTGEGNQGGRFNRTNTSYNPGAIDPKISAYEDVNGEFISIVMFTPNASTNTANIENAFASGSIGSEFGQGGENKTNDPRLLSVNVGRIEVVLPNDFTATSASALRSYGWENATGEVWDDVPRGSPRYWINEPVFLSNSNGRWAVEVTLPGGNVISIMVKGRWAAGSRETASPRRLRPYTVD
jgi:hypothetical protein